MNVAIWIFGVCWALILYTYIGFPILLGIFARLFDEKGRQERIPAETAASIDQVNATPAALPRVAMVVAAYNEEAVIASKLANTWEIDYPADRFEIWIGSDGSSDGTDEIVRSCTDARLRYRPYAERRGKISVLNDLISEIDADILVMSDANTIYAKDAVLKLIAHFDDARVGCVSGELGLTQDGGVSGEGLYWKYESWIKRNESRLGFLIGCNGGIFALRRECFEPLPKSTIVEDFVMTMRIVERRHRVVFDPAARACEPPCVSSKAEMVRKVRIGAGGFQALGLTGRLLLPTYGFAAFAFWGHKVMRWLVPFFFLAAIAANLVLWRTPVFTAFLGMQIVGAALALLAYNGTTGPAMPRWTRPISYFYLMNYSLFCGFLRFIMKTQRVTWDRHTPTSSNGSLSTTPSSSP